MTQDVADKLTQAKALIATPETWLQCDLKQGAQRCALQAISEVCGFGYGFGQETNQDPTVAALSAALVMASGKTYHGIGDVCALNNRLNHAELMAVFDRAIVAATP